MKQQKLFSEKKRNEFGGSLLAGHRKERRPLSGKLPIHLVLKASDPFSLLKNKNRVERIIKKYSAKMGVVVYETAVHADHIHLAIRALNRDIYVRWIRAVTSVLAQKVLGLKWRLRPYTRVATWGIGFRRLKEYILDNKREGNFIVEAHARVDQFVEERIRPLFSCADP